jgi:hypothetical protein
VEDEGAPEVEKVEQETKDKPVLEKSGEGQS